ncbi:MAG: hypothetical protein HFI72_01790 [Peptococcaceae bacterium]|nr:hypothetical protein [Peptococcaceae bacterium]
MEIIGPCREKPVGARLWGWLFLLILLVAAGKEQVMLWVVADGSLRNQAFEMCFFVW